MQRHAARAVVIDLEPALLHDAAGTRIELIERCGNAIAGQQVALVRFDQRSRLMAGVGQVGDGAISVFSIVTRARVEQHVAAGHALLHLDDLFALDLQRAGHRIDLVFAQGLAVGRHLGVVFEALLHGAQVEKQLALGLGGGHLDHAPVAQDVFVNFSLDPVQRIADQAHPLVGIEAFDRLHQPDVALLNEVGMWQPVAQVFA